MATFCISLAMPILAENSGSALGDPRTKMAGFDGKTRGKTWKNYGKYEGKYGYPSPIVFEFITGKIHPSGGN
jgi:hypothetical protein